MEGFLNRSRNSPTWRNGLKQMFIAPSLGLWMFPSLFPVEFRASLSCFENTIALHRCAILKKRSNTVCVSPTMSLFLPAMRIRSVDPRSNYLAWTLEQLPLRNARNPLLGVGHSGGGGECAYNARHCSSNQGDNREVLQRSVDFHCQRFHQALSEEFLNSSCSLSSVMPIYEQITRFQCEFRTFQFLSSLRSELVCYEVVTSIPVTPCLRSLLLI